MLQTKFCVGLDIQDLNRNVNDALCEIKDDHPKILYYPDQLTAIIEYQTKDRKLMCVDCQFYDASGDPCRKAFGLCQFHGKRVRFSECVCRDFLDVRS